jgi:hypothetical protein
MWLKLRVNEIVKRKLKKRIEESCWIWVKDLELRVGGGIWEGIFEKKKGGK